LLDEILPTVDVPDAEAYAHVVLDRFENPHIRHALVDITLHGTTKLQVRIVPTLLRTVEQAGRVPDALALGFAAHLVRLSTGALGMPASESVPVDELGDRVRAAWSGVDAQE